MNKFKNKKIRFCSFMFGLLFVFTNLVGSVFASGNTEAKDSCEFRGVWISFLDLKPIIYQKTAEEFSDGFEKMMENSKKLNLTDVIVQVRPFSDSLYNSKFFPTSHLITGNQGDRLSFDPLEIMVKKAHEHGLKIHAWINPYRIQNIEKIALADNHPAKSWVESNDTSKVIKMKDGSIHFNPSSIDAMRLVISGVKEIVQNYEVDGIHIDDYFYPTTDKWIDQDAYKTYVSGGGKLSLESWRMNNVDMLMRSVYSIIKNTKPSVLFGISPAGNIDKNYEILYADVKKWCSRPGYLDYICPQIYFGFFNEACPFKKTLNIWKNIIELDNIKLYVGLAFYKVGSEDKWAGKGKKEWIDDKQVIQKQVDCCKSDEKCDGFVFFRYDNIFNPDLNIKALVNTIVSDLK